MADEVDSTADRAEREAPYLIAASMKPVGPKPTGFCAWCHTPFEKDSQQRFCDTDCRNDYEYLRNRRRVAGET